ncbi:hypothetical protein [uncultured Halomonas sp.]|uniref:hypothetical protein n=1 Tax=uncultured Halomonas sp. TaxID=173971 RepID=UPI0026163C4B|nr:hypothetical protein [uncultured Halomonas sp.]
MTNLTLKTCEEVYCVNCKSAASPETLKPISEIVNLGERLTPGDSVPAGECPTCGGLVYIRTQVVKLNEATDPCPNCGGTKFYRTCEDDYSGSVDAESGVLCLSTCTVFDSGPVRCAGCGVEIDFEFEDIEY